MSSWKDPVEAATRLREQLAAARTALAEELEQKAEAVIRASALREQLDAAAIGLDLAIGVHDKLRMDTAEEEALRLEVLRTLRLARAALGVEGEQEKSE